MRHILQSLLLLVFLVAPCLAQETPAWQLFAGYSFQRADVREYFKSTPIIYTARHHYVNMNGVEFSATENRNSWFGGTLDLSAYFKTPQLGSVSNQERIYSILYGPRISYPHPIRGGTAYAHALFGAAHSSVSVTPTGPHANDFSFGMAIGGGFDLPFRNGVSVRVLQLEYLRTAAYGSGQNNYRLSAGVVFNTGTAK
jgi:Outer membrane protein beta-barrel domain